MPTLPTIISKESVRVGGINTQASPNAFGYQVGRAMQGLGESIQGLSSAAASAMERQKEKKGKLELATAIANTDLGKIAMDEQKAAPPDGSGIADNTFKKQKDEIDRMADATFPNDPDNREKYKITMYERLPGWRDRSRQVEAVQGEQNAKVQTNSALDTLINKVRADPSQYDEVAKDADGIADAGNYNADTKVVVKQQLHSDLAHARFESMIGNANSDDDFARVEGELKDPRWQKEMSKEQFDQTLQALKTSRNSFLTGQDAQARTILSGMKERSKAREVIPQDEINELSTFVRGAHSPAINSEFIRLQAEQQILRNFKDAPPAQLDHAAKIVRSNSPEIQGQVGQWASEASRATGGEVSASYISSMVGLEYRASDIKAGRFNVKNPDSSARGFGQFIDKTWIDMMQKYGSRFGYDPSRMTPQQLLGLRGDPGLSAKMTALYAMENRRYMLNKGIMPNDTDLYLAHFLGPAGAVAFLRAKNADPTGRVRPYGAFGAEAIAQNRGVFGSTRGTTKSFQQAYNDIARKMAPGTTQAQFDSATYLEGMRDDKQRAVDADPMTQYRADGKMGDYELSSPSSFATAGADAAGAASYYNIPIPDMKPFTQQDAATLKKQLLEGNSDQQLELMANIANMDRGAPGMAKAAMAQLGEKDTVLGYAASLMYDKNEGAVAAQIVRGQKIIKEDKTLAGAFGTEGEALQSFYATVGSSLAGMSPSMRDSIFNAAKAHYAETYAQRQGQVLFDTAQFQTSVNAVLGANQGEPVGEINGAYTVLPQGITAEVFDTALSNMTDGDLAAMSRDQVPPKDVYGEVVPASDVAEEGQFVWIGKDTYKIRMADGLFLATGKPDPKAPYNVLPFVFIAKPYMLKQFATEEQPQASPDAEVAQPQPGHLKDLIAPDLQEHLP